MHPCWNVPKRFWSVTHEGPLRTCRRIGQANSASPRKPGARSHGKCAPSFQSTSPAQCRRRPPSVLESMPFPWERQSEMDARMGARLPFLECVRPCRRFPSPGPCPGAAKRSFANKQGTRPAPPSYPRRRVSRLPSRAPKARHNNSGSCAVTSPIVTQKHLGQAAMALTYGKVAMCRLFETQFLRNTGHLGLTPRVSDNDKESPSTSRRQIHCPAFLPRPPPSQHHPLTRHQGEVPALKSASTVLPSSSHAFSRRGNSDNNRRGASRCPSPRATAGSPASPVRNSQATARVPF